MDKLEERTKLLHPMHDKPIIPSSHQPIVSLDFGCVH